MRNRIMILVFVLLWSLAATAQEDYGENRIGIFADLEGLSSEVAVEAGTPLEVYVLIINPTGTQKLGGAEWRLIAPDNVTLWGWSYPQTGVGAFTDPPDFMVVWEPVPYQDVNHVQTMIISPADSQPALFYLEAHSTPSQGDSPVLLDVDYDVDPGGGVIINLDPYPDGMGQPTFVINSGALPTVAASWGDVKALYN